MVLFFFSSRRRHTRCALVTGVQTCALPIFQLGDADELPQDARLTFSMRAQTPARFTMQQQIEVATADETFSTTLAIGNGIKLENSKVALASLEPEIGRAHV